MIITGLAFVVVGLSVYIWMTRGFFSAFLHMLCVIVAGAIAFGVWEPLGYLILDKAPDRSATFLMDWSWAMALALPFAISLALLRFAVDSFLPGNAIAGKVPDYVGGAVCGLVSGIITAGMMVLSIGFVRMPSDFGGYQLVGYSSGAARGNIERQGGALVPHVDQITARFYSFLSSRTLRTSSPLATWHPDFATLPASMRLTYENVSRNTHKPNSFQIIGAYDVGDPKQPGQLSALLTDEWNKAGQPKAADLRGEPITTGYVAGYIVKFNAGARERPGNVAVGSGQVRLVVSDEDGNSQALHPVAVVTQQDDPTKVDYQRFRFDQDNLFMSSVGATAEPVMGFEFAVPAGTKPLALYVKGVRTDVTTTQPIAYAAPADRDIAIASGEFKGMGGVGPVLGADGNPVQASGSGPVLDQNPFSITASLGFQIQKGQERSLTVTQGARGWSIVEGEETISGSDKRVDIKLMIGQFEVSSDQAMVQINFTPMQRSSEFGQALDSAERLAAPRLVDTNGQTYDAVGYIFRDGKNVKVRYTRGSPLRALSEAPNPGRNDEKRKLTLLFVVSNGVEIKELTLGGNVIESYNPPRQIQMAPGR